MITNIFCTCKEQIRSRDEVLRGERNIIKHQIKQATGSTLLIQVFHNDVFEGV